MRKLLLSLTLVLVSTLAFGQQAKKPQLQLQDFKENLSQGGMANLGYNMLKKTWPLDTNGEEPCARICVKFENMPDNLAGKVAYAFDKSSGVSKIENRLNEPEQEIWVFVNPSNSTFMEASLSGYGTSNRLPGLKLESKHTYSVVLHNEKTISITITTKPEGLMTSVDGGPQKATPATFTDLSLGKHQVKIMNGNVEVKKEIEVSEQNVAFDYDLRPTKRVSFDSDPRGAELLINGQKRGTLPCEVELPFDSYQVEARLDDVRRDVKAITVDDKLIDVVKLRPIPKVSFNVTGYYNSSRVPATLSINGKQEEKVQTSYPLTLEVNKTYRMKMFFKDGVGKKSIRATMGMNPDQTINIQPKNRFVWPWQREYDSAPFGFSMGYVQKQMVTSGNGEKLKENGVWNDGEGKWLHGMQIGFHFQPCFSWGGGLYTGLFYELYMSDNDEGMEGYTKFMEHDIYVPAHVLFRLPFAKKVALTVHGGLGFNYAAYGEYKADEEDGYTTESFTDFYGEDAWPKRFNMALEIGGSFRVGPVQINVQYSKGLTNHGSYESQGDYKTRINKLSVGASWVIGSD